MRPNSAADYSTFYLFLFERGLLFPDTTLTNMIVFVVEDMKLIVTALADAFFPVMSAFVLVILLVAVYAIIAVQGPCMCACVYVCQVCVYAPPLFLIAVQGLCMCPPALFLP